MAGNVKPNVYTGATAALSVIDENGVKQRIAYATDFTLDLSSNTEDFNVLGQIYQESIATYNNWTASSSAKASFENNGQNLLLLAYNTLSLIQVEFIVNQTADDSKKVMFSGFASIESLSIGVGDGVTSLDISLKGAGNLTYRRPKVTKVTSITVTPDEYSMVVGETIQLSYTVVPSNASNPFVTWSSSDETKATVTEQGFVVAIAKTGKNEDDEDEPVIITCTSEEDSTIKNTCSIIIE